MEERERCYSFVLSWTLHETRVNYEHHINAISQLRELKRTTESRLKSRRGSTLFHILDTPRLLIRFQMNDFSESFELNHNALGN
jgi:hypothetical protein